MCTHETTAGSSTLLCGMYDEIIAMGNRDMDGLGA